MKIAIRIISLLGTLITGILAYSHIMNIKTCPLFLDIPACFLVEIAFILILLSTFQIRAKRNFLLFSIGFIVGEVNGIWFTINQLIGNDYCPKYFEIPLCYVSLITFTTLIVLKYLEYTSKNNAIYEYK